jgi:8-oxo-dGTP diphosphatase
MTIIDKLAWIEIENDKVLSSRSKGKNIFYIPGGKREANENDAQVLIREIREELSVELQENTLQYIGTFEAQADGHQTGIIVRMTCYSGQYIGTLKPSSEIEEISWLSVADKDKISAVDKIIFDWLKIHNFL